MHRDIMDSHLLWHDRAVRRYLLALVFEHLARAQVLVYARLRTRRRDLETRAAPPADLSAGFWTAWVQAVSEFSAIQWLETPDLRRLLRVPVERRIARVDGLALSILHGHGWRWPRRRALSTAELEAFRTLDRVRAEVSLEFERRVRTHLRRWSAASHRYWARQAIPFDGRRKIEPEETDHYRLLVRAMRLALHELAEDEGESGVA